MSAAAPLAESAPAKINLYLRVTGRRADGYHELDSLAVFAAAADRLTAEPAGRLSLEIAGPFAFSLDAGADNLVLRAARALAAEAGYGPGARLVLHKSLPVASGIGGGSADAAAALRLLDRLWGTRLPAERMMALARGLGADLPVCLASAPRRMAGVGEALSEAPGLPPFGLALLNPGVAVATAEVFRSRAPGFGPEAVLPPAWAGLPQMVASLRELPNDLEAPAVALCPAIADALAVLRAARGCRFAAMSGSGATCFGLFDTAREAAGAAPALARPGWWAWGGGLFARPAGGP